MSNKELVKVSHCQIHLREPSRTAAATTLFPFKPNPMAPSIDLNEALRAGFTGPHFHGIAKAQCSDGTFDVILEDRTVYMYPLDTVARVKVYETTHTPE